MLRMNLIYACRYLTFYFSLYITRAKRTTLFSFQFSLFSLDVLQSPLKLLGDAAFGGRVRKTT